MASRRFLLITSLFIIAFLSTSCSWGQPPTSTFVTPISLTIPTPTSMASPTESITPSPSPSPSPTSSPTSSATASPSPEPTEEAVSETTETQEVPQKIVVGSKDSTEQLLLGQILILALQEAGYEVVDKTGIEGTEAVRRALEDGEIDLYWEYIGTALSNVHDQPPEFNETQASLMLVRRLDEPQGLLWLDTAAFNSSYTLMIEASNVAQGLVTLEDLANFMNKNDAPLTLCVDSEFFAGADGLSALQEHYGFEFKEENILLMEFDQIYQHLREGKCEVAEGHMTDGRIVAWNFHNLEDTRQFFPPYNAAPVVRKELLDAHPELADQLTQLVEEIGPRLDDKTISVLNACVDIGPDAEAETGDEKTVEEVAQAFLAGEPIDCLPPRIVVSSHNVAPESVWLGKMLVYLLKEAGYDVVDKTGLGRPPVMRKAMLANEIDLYWEAVSFALMLFHGIPPAAFPADPARSFTLAKSLDKPLGITWLKRADQVKFASMLVVRNETYEEGIRTIEELAAFMNANDSPFKVCTNASVAQRPDGIPGVEAFYGFKFKPENMVITDNLADESFVSLRDGDCDVAHALTTDNLDAWEFQALEDNRDFFPPFTPAPVIRQEILDEHPELVPLIEQASDFLSDDGMNELNRLLEVGRDGEPDSGDEESMDTIARLALCQAGLLEDCSGIPAELIALGQANNEESNPACEEIVLNGSFEIEEDWFLPATAGQAKYTTDVAHSGEQALGLGPIGESDDFANHSVARQSIWIPNNAESVTLTFWYYPMSSDSAGGDYHGALVYNSNVSFIRRQLLRGISNEQAWVLETHDMSAFTGERVNLYFYVESDGDGNASGMYLDDVSVEICYAE